MNKICGYNCEHNKGGVCQITICDKIGNMTTTTQWLSGGRQQGKTYQLIKDQQKEIERLNNIITKLELYLINERINNWKVDEWTIMKIQNELEKLKEGK